MKLTFSGKVIKDDMLASRLPPYISNLFGSEKHYFVFGDLKNVETGDTERVIWVKKEGEDYNYGVAEHKGVYYKHLASTKNKKWILVKKYFDYLIECKNLKQKTTSKEWKGKFEELRVSFEKVNVSDSANDEKAKSSNPPTKKTSNPVPQKKQSQGSGIFSFFSREVLTKASSSSEEESGESDSDESGSEESDDDDDDKKADNVKQEVSSSEDEDEEEEDEEEDDDEESEEESEEEEEEEHPRQDIKVAVAKDSSNLSETEDDSSIDNNTQYRAVRYPNDTRGYVYIMEDQPNRFKVGSSRNPRNRHKTFLTSNIDIKLRTQYLVEKRITAEKMCHRRLEKFRVIGHQEWFSNGLNLHSIELAVESALQNGILKKEKV